jgi:hypothetical protein
MSTLTTNSAENVTLQAGSTGSITVFADAGGGQVTVTSAAHGLSEDDYITIAGTTNYNGVFQATNVTTDTFEITDTWVADDATGTWHRGSYLEIQHRGRYRLEWSFSMASAGSNKTFDFTLFNGTTEISEARRQRKFSAAGDVGIGAGNTTGFLERGDRVWYGFRNITDANNITLSAGTVNANKIN